MVRTGTRLFQLFRWHMIKINAHQAFEFSHEVDGDTGMYRTLLIKEALVALEGEDSVVPYVGMDIQSG